MTAKTLWILSAAALLAASVCQVRTIQLHSTLNMEATVATETSGSF
jgi:hypothetical protein